MDLDLKTFRELVLWVWRSHEKPWVYSNETARNIADKYLHFRGAFAKDLELENHLPSEDIVKSDFGPNRYLYLNPVSDAGIMVPLLQISCDFGRLHAEVRCRLVLYLLYQDSLHALGFRFESPEGKNSIGRGIHHYFHSQIIHPPGPQIQRTPWLPTTQPAFPLDADNPVGLLLCILIGLYGVDYLAKLRAESGIWKLEGYIDKMYCHNIQPTVSYWRVNIGNPVRYSYYYLTSVEANIFVNAMRRRYAGCELMGITRTFYDSLKDNDRLVFPD